MKYLIIATIVLSIFSIVNTVAWIVAYFRADRKLAEYGKSKLHEEVKNDKIGF